MIEFSLAGGMSQRCSYSSFLQCFLCKGGGFRGRDRAVGSLPWLRAQGTATVPGRIATPVTAEDVALREEGPADARVVGLLGFALAAALRSLSLRLDALVHALHDEDFFLYVEVAAHQTEFTLALFDVFADVLPLVLVALEPVW